MSYASGAKKRFTAQVQFEGGVDSTTMGADATLDKKSANFMALDPNGSDRVVTLPDLHRNKGVVFWIRHAGTANTITVKDDAASTVVTVYAGESVLVGSTGTESPEADGAWVVLSHVTGGVVLDLEGQTTGTPVVKLTDNLAAAWTIEEASNVYLKFVTTNGAESVTVAKALVVTGGTIDASSGATDVKIPDNNATAMRFREGTNDYIILCSTDSGERVQVEKHLLVDLGIGSTPATAQDIATGNTITLPTAGYTKRLTASGGAATGVILPAGTIDGQELFLINADAANDITMAAAGTSRVADGTGCVVTHLTAKRLVWDNTSSRWYRST